MIKACKICEHEIPTPQLGDDWWCPKCRRYSIVVDENSIVESETVNASNYNLHFFPQYKEATVVEKGDENHRIIHKFAMNELTHELAVQWVKKLKLYVTFQ